MGALEGGNRKGHYRLGRMAESRDVGRCEWELEAGPGLTKMPPFPEVVQQQSKSLLWIQCRLSQPVYSNTSLDCAESHLSQSQTNNFWTR